MEPRKHGRRNVEGGSRATRSGGSTMVAMSGTWSVGNGRQVLSGGNSTRLYEIIWNSKRFYEKLCNVLSGNIMHVKGFFQNPFIQMLQKVLIQKFLNDIKKLTNE